jgi:hypothetical protein
MPVPAPIGLTPRLPSAIDSLAAVLLAVVYEKAPGHVKRPSRRQMAEAVGTVRNAIDQTGRFPSLNTAVGIWDASQRLLVSVSEDPEPGFEVTPLGQKSHWVLCLAVTLCLARMDWTSRSASVSQLLAGMRALADVAGRRVLAGDAEVLQAAKSSNAFKRGEASAAAASAMGKSSSVAAASLSAETAGNPTPRHSRLLRRRVALRRDHALAKDVAGTTQAVVAECQIVAGAHIAATSRIEAMAAEVLVFAQQLS